MKTEAGALRMSEVNLKNSRSNHGDGYFTVNAGFRCGNKLEHRVIVEKIIGQELPVKAVVHHIDGNRGNNDPSNLVVCNDDQHHRLIHRRARALKECGHPDWRQCYYCKQWDAPENLYIPPKGGAVEHRACGRKYRAEYVKNKRIAEGKKICTPTTVLTEQKVAEIRGKFGTGKYTMKALADEYGVGSSQINRIIKHISWAHI